MSAISNNEEGYKRRRMSKVPRQSFDQRYPLVEALSTNPGLTLEIHPKKRQESDRREFPIGIEKLLLKLDAIPNPAEDHYEKAQEHIDKNIDFYLQEGSWIHESDLERVWMELSRQRPLQKKSLLVSCDGPNKSGKSIGSQLVGTLLERGDRDGDILEPMYFKETQLADPVLELKRKQFFRDFGLFGGDTLKRLALLNLVRISASYSPRFREALEEQDCHRGNGRVVFLNRSFFTTVAYTLFTSLGHKNKYQGSRRRLLKRDRARFLCDTLNIMANTALQQDMALMYMCDPLTANLRLAHSGEMSGQYPPPRIYNAYDLITEALFCRGKQSGKYYCDNNLNISGYDDILRIVSDLPSGVDASQFFGSQNRYVAEAISTRFKSGPEKRTN